MSFEWVDNMEFFLKSWYNQRKLNAIIANSKKEAEPKEYLDDELSALLEKIEQYTRLGMGTKNFSFPMRIDLRRLVGQLETRAMRVGNDYRNLILLKKNPSTGMNFPKNYKTNNEDHSVDELAANLAKAEDCKQKLACIYSHLKQVDE